MKLMEPTEMKLVISREISHISQRLSRQLLPWFEIMKPYKMPYLGGEHTRKNNLQRCKLCPWDFPGKSAGVGCHFLLPGIFPTQESNLGLPHCRQTVYRLSHQGSPRQWVNSRTLGRGAGFQQTLPPSRSFHGSSWVQASGVILHDTVRLVCSHLNPAWIFLDTVLFCRCLMRQLQCAKLSSVQMWHSPGILAI